MHFFRHASLQQKQMRIIMGICTLALLLASAGFLIQDTLSRRKEMASFQLTRSDVLGRTCWGALDFKDPKAAEENLNALQADPRMISATVFTTDGKFFARYHRAGTATPAPSLFSTNAVSVFAGGRLRAAWPILRGNEPLGFIVLESDLEALYAAMKYQTGIAGLVFTLATALAFFLSARLQRLISGPILGLLETTRAVAADRNYALRARKESTDELGQLVDGFNDMLQQVQSRDAELQQAQNFLEKRVEDRTEELKLEVAERRRSEQTVLESQQFLQSTLDALSAHIAILDESGVILSVNAAWNRFAQANEHTIGGLSAGGNYLDVCDRARGECAEEAPAVARGIRAVMAGETEEFRLEYPCHSPNEKRWFIVRITRFGTEDARRIVVAHENITERKEAEVRLRIALHKVESQQFALNESSIVGITDRRGRMTYVNDKFCAISKYSREELLGQDHRIINSGHHPKEFFKTLWATVSRGEVWRGRVCNRAKDGSLYWVDTTIVPFKDESGAITQHVVIRSDVTDRVQAEDELAKAHKNSSNLSPSPKPLSSRHRIPAA